MAKINERLGKHASGQMVTVLAGHAARMTLGLASSVILARALGPIGLGTFAVAGAGITIMATLADLGLNNTAVNFIGSRLHSRPAEAAELGRMFAMLKGAAVLFLCAVLVSLESFWIGLLDLPADQGQVLIWIAAGTLLVRAFSGVISAYLQVHQHFNVLVLTQSLNAVLTLIIFGGLFGLGRLDATTALVTGAATAAVGSILGLMRLPTSWLSALRTARPGFRPHGPALISFGKWIGLATGLIILYFQLDLLLVNRLAPAASTGHYALAFNLSMKANVLVQTAHLVLLPLASRLTDRQGLQDYLRRSWRQMGAMSALLLLALVPAAFFIELIYGIEFAASVTPFRLLSLIVVLDLLTMPIDLLAYPLNVPWATASTNAVRLLSLIGFALVFIPALGLVGAAVAKIFAKGVSAVFMAVVIRRKAKSFGQTSHP